MRALYHFFVENFPRPIEWAVGGPLCLGWAFCCLALAGYLKQHKELRTGYTRKTFHFLIFGTAVALQVLGGTRLVCLFGSMTSLVIFYAVWRGSGHPLYEAMARHTDAPHRSRYVLVPYFATLMGGVLANVLFGPVAAVGYLVTGIGDAVGEPFGVRFGRHPYRVWTLDGVRATRTFEGSLAVFVFSTAAVALAYALVPELDFGPRAFFAIPFTGLMATLCEAVSPHGWDNATLQLIPSGLVLVFG